MRQAEQTQAFETEQQPTDNLTSSYVNTSLDGKTSQEIKTLENYIQSTDPFVKQQIAAAREGHVKRVNIGVVDNEIAENTLNQTGVNIAGRPIILQSSVIQQEIDLKHGKEGKHNHSMENDNDLARIYHVLKTADKIEKAGTIARYGYADKLVYYKTVDGTYVVIEAVPKDSVVYITGAYITENNKEYGRVGQRKRGSALADAKAPTATPKDGEQISSANIIQTTPADSQPLSENLQIPATDNGDGTAALSDGTVVFKDAFEKLSGVKLVSPAATQLLKADIEVLKRVGMSARSDSQLLETYKQARQYGIERSTAAAMSAAQSKTGVRFAYDTNAKGEGSYANGVITLNPNAFSIARPAVLIAVHELTHLSETSAQYAEMAKDITGSRVFNDWLQENGYSTLAQLQADIAEQYAANGVQLDTEEKERAEAVAKFMEHVFADENSVARLVTEKPGLVQRIRNFLEELRVKLVGTDYEKELLRIRQQFDRALKGADVGKFNKGQLFSAMYKSRADGFSAFYDFVMDNRNNKSEQNKSYYTVSFSDGGMLDVPFDAVLHGYNRHVLSKDNFADIFDGINRGAVSATCRATGSGSINAILSKMLIETQNGAAGVMVDFQPSGRVLLRTAFLDNADAIAEWTKKDGFKALHCGKAMGSTLLDNRISLKSIQDEVRENNPSEQKNFSGASTSHAETAAREFGTTANFNEVASTQDAGGSRSLENNLPLSERMLAQIPTYRDAITAQGLLPAVAGVQPQGADARQAAAPSPIVMFVRTLIMYPNFDKTIQGILFWGVFKIFRE